MAIGRISGPLLKSNLLRDGVDLAFENDLLYLKVTPVRQGNQNSFNDSALPPFEDGDPNYSDSGSNSGPLSAIGIKTDTPQYDLDVNGTIGSVSSFFGFLQVDDVIINDSTITTELYDLTISAAETRKVLFDRSVDIDGDLYVTGNIRADGSLTLGDSTTDDIIFNADINSNIIPNITDIFNIGSALKRWNDLYTVSAEIGNIAIDGNSITALNSDGDIIIDANAAGSVIINNVLEVTPTNVILADTEIQSAAVLNLVPGRVVLAGPNSAIIDSANLTFESGELGVGADIVPKLDGIYDIGTSTFKWRNFYVDNMISTSSLVGGDLTVTGNGYFDGNVTVGADDSATAALLTNAETFDLINNTAITVNFAGAATDINIGAYTGTTTVNNQLVVLDGIVVGSVEVFDAYGNLLVPAAEADKLTTPREIALDGDISGFTLFDGSINVSITATLDTVNASPGTFGSITSIPVVTVNGKGLVTEITTADIATTLTIVGDDSTEYTLSLLNERLMFVGTDPVNITINENEAVISIDDATDISKGIASFNNNGFTVVSGAVDLKTVNTSFGTYGSATAIPIITADEKGRITSITTADIATSLRIRGDDSTEDTVDLLNDVLEFIGNGPIQTTVTDDRVSFSIDDATTTTKGVASFDSDGFTVTSGAVDLANVNVDIGTYGSATAIPIITADEKGRITSISTAEVASSLRIRGDDSTEDTVDLLNDVLEFIGNGPIQTTVTDDRVSFSIDDATTTTKGVASFSTNDFNVASGDVTIKNVNLGTQTTGDYVASITGTTNQVIVSDDSAEGKAITLSTPQDIATTSSPTFANLLLTGELQGPATFVIDPAALGDNTGTVVIKGSLQVDGTTTTINSTVTTIDDPIFTLGGDAPLTFDDNKDRGIEFFWHDGVSAKLGFFGFDDSTGKFTFIPDATNTSEVFSGTKGEIDANIDWTNILNLPDPTITIAGDVDGSATMTNLGSVTINVTLDTVNPSVGTYGSATTIPVITADGKGRITNITTADIATSLRIRGDDSTEDTVDLLNDVLEFIGNGPIQTTVTDDRVSFSIDDATTTTKGAASFNSSTFTVTSGAVDLANVNVDIGTYGSATAIPVITVNAKGQITNVDTASIATSLRIRGDDSTEDTVDLLNDVLEFIGNGPLQTTVTDDRVSFSIDDATTTTKGVASFDTNNFTVVSGAVATKNITLGTSTLTLGSTTTALAGLTQLDIDNLRLAGNTISSTNTNGDILITPNGTGSVIIDGINLGVFDENTYYVSEDGGNDLNDGRRIQTAFSTLKYALTQAVAGDTILLLPGVFEEEFPLTVPAGVTVKGGGLRATSVKPTAGTNNKDAFLLNGGTTLEDFTIRDMFYDSINDTGYAFRFAPGTVVNERSPYIQRITILNKGSVTSTNDPYGFNQGDAGRGALVDGAVVSRGSIEAAMLFNEVTFIVPNSRALIITNGGRVEWLTCFTYFADLAIEGKVGTTGRGGDGKTLLEFGGVSGAGFQVGETIQISETDDSTVVNLVIDSIVGNYVFIDGKVDSLEGIDRTPKNGAGIVGLTSGTTATSIARYDRSEFAAEMRAIAGANVYGNQGVKADGDDVTIQLMAHNFAYIGTQADLTNNKSGVVQANEAIEVNGGRIYYNSVDQNGNFRVGDLFSVNFETGEVSFEAPTFNISSLTGITFTDGTNTTVVNPTGITTGNLILAGNTISTLTGPIILDPSGTNQIQFNGETIFSQPAIISSLQVSDLTAGRVVLAGTSGELEDSANLTFNGTTLNVDGDLEVSGDIRIGGNIRIGDQDVDTITVIADFTSNLTPDVTNTYDLGTDAKRWRIVNAVEFNNDAIKIRGNTISTTESNANLQLDPSGTGNIDVSSTKIINLATPLDGTDAANKDYVDSVVSAVVTTLNIDADAGTPDTVTLGVDTFTISGTAGEIATAVTNNTVTISLIETGVAATTYGSATAIPVITVNANGQLTNVTTANIATSLRIRGDDSTEDTVDLLNDVLEFIGNGPLQTTVTDDRITFSIDDATATTKGVASFDANYFTVTTGAVTLADANNDAGTYGSATTIPIITINAKGQVTDISTATISSSFFVAADAGQEIFSTGNTLTVAGGIGLSTTVTDDSSQTVVTVNLDNTTVVAGSYGSSSKIATFTVDAQGRITTAGEQNIATTLSIVGNSGADTVSLITDSLTFTGTAPIVTAVTDNTVTISATDATTTTKGVASFSTDNFAVAAGVVTIKDGGIANAELANSAVTFGTTTVALGSTSLILEGLDRLNVDNIEIINNEIRSTDTNGNISLNPNGTGYVSVNNAYIKNLANPQDDQDAATKFYVDNAITGLTWKNSAHLLADTNVALLGATGTLIIDEHPALEGGDDGYRILLLGQSTASENGIYVYNDDSSVYTLTRAADADTYQELVGAAIFIKEGTIYANTGWVQSNHYLTDFNNQQWVQFSGAGAYTAGAGLSANGTEFNVNVATNGGIEIVSDNLQLKHTVAGDGLTITNGVLDVGGTADRITVSANNVDIASTYAGQASITTLGIITSGTWNGNVIPVLHGGTGTATGSITGIGDLTFTTETTNGNIILSPNGVGIVDVTGPLKADNITIDGGYVSFRSTPNGAEKSSVRALAPVSVTANTATAIDSWSATDYRTAKYVIQVTQGSKYQSSEILVVHDSTNATFTEYAVVETNTSNPIPMTISCEVIGGNVVVSAAITDAASTNAEILILRTLLAVA